MQTMSQVERVMTQLAKNTKGSGITVNALASRARVPRDSVYKRIHDLRNEGFRIFTNQKNGKTYYRLAS